MASSYPGALDSFTNPSSTDAMDASAALYHDVQHANANDALEAIQAELGTDPAGGAATVKARLDYLGLGFVRHVLWPKTGYYYHSAPVGNFSNAQAVTANRLYCTPFYCPSPVTTSSLVVNITTNATGDMRLGIYADSYSASTGHVPGSLVVDAGTASTGSNGYTEVASSQALVGDTLYWLAAVFSAAPTCAYHNFTAHGAGLTVDNSDNSAALMGAGYYSHTYGSLPNPPSGSYTINPYVPVIWVEL